MRAEQRQLKHRLAATKDWPVGRAWLDRAKQNHLPAEYRQ